jgi:predicted nucleic acid-binding protein
MRHWYLDVANVLWIAQRQKRISHAEAMQFVARLGMTNIEDDYEFAARAFDHILPLSHRYGLTSYDAAYLELALRRQLPLATLDDQLRAAAQQVGIPVLGK